MKSKKHQQGMTLLELLIATVIMAIMAGMGFIGINAMVEASSRVELKSRQVQQQSMVLTQVSRDVASAISSRQQVSQVSSDFTGDSTRFELTRFEQALLPGVSEGQNMGDVIQVAWYLRNGQLFRSSRPSVQKNNSQAWRDQLMGEVKGWRCEYRDISGQWQPKWPNTPSEHVLLPKVIKCQVTAADGRVSDWQLVPWQAT